MQAALSTELVSRWQSASVPQEGLANPADAGLYTMQSSDAGDLVRVSTTLPGGFEYGYSPDGYRILYARFANEHCSQ